MLTTARKITLTACALAVWGISIADAADRAAPAARVGPLAGTWLIEGNPEPTCGVPPFANIATIDTFGFLTNVDPVVGTGVGEVRRVAPNSFDASFFGFLDPATTYSVHGNLQLAGANLVNGTFDATISDLGGNELCTYAGTVTGTRLVP